MSATRLGGMNTSISAMAVGLEEGLITPVIRGCGTKTLETISAESRALIERAKQKRLQPLEYNGATFSISNLCMFGVDNFLAVRILPQADSPAVGAVRDMPVIVAGAVRAGRSMQVTLSCDHRAIDGVTGARFLIELKRPSKPRTSLLIRQQPGDGALL